MWEMLDRLYLWTDERSSSNGMVVEHAQTRAERRRRATAAVFRMATQFRGRRLDGLLGRQTSLEPFKRAIQRYEPTIAW